MRYSSLIKGTRNYILESNIDLATVIYVNNIYLYFYQALEDPDSSTDSIFDDESGLFYKKGEKYTTFKNFTSSTPEGYLSVETRNEDKTLFDLQFINQDYSLLGISLFKQNVVAYNNTKTFEYHQIYPDILTFQTESIFLTCKNKEGNVSVSLVKNPKDTIQYRSIRTFFERESTYKIILDFSKIFDDESLSTPVELNFVTSENLFSSNNYNTYSNNIIFTNNKMTSIGDIDTILNTSTLNYKFIPTTFNEDNTIVKQTDTNNKELYLNYNTHQTILDLYIIQYLEQYSDFFKLIDEINSTNPFFSSKHIKRIILEYSKLMNSSLKGNLDGIYKLLDIFCNATSYYLLSVEENPSQNFVYRVTSTIPEEYWNIIKKICHPLSWKCEYIQLNITSNKANIFNTSKPICLYDKKNIITYLDYQFNPVFTKERNILLLSNEYLGSLFYNGEFIYSGIYNYSTLNTIEEIVSKTFKSYKFNYRYTPYKVTEVFQPNEDQEFLDQLSQPNLLSVTNQIISDNLKITYNYQYNSSLQYYTFDFYYDNKLIVSKVQPTSSGSITIPSYYTNYTLVVSVIFNSHKEQVILYNNSL